MGPGEHPMIDAALRSMVLSGTSLASEAVLPAPAITPTPPVPPLQWLLPLRFQHSPCYNFLRSLITNCRRHMAPLDAVDPTIRLQEEDVEE